MYSQEGKAKGGLEGEVVELEGELAAVEERVRQLIHLIEEKMPLYKQVNCSSSVENVFWNGENSSRLELEGLKSEKLLWYNIAFTPKCQIVPFLLLFQLCHHTITLFEAKLEQDVSGKQGPGGESETRESDPWQQEESRFPWGGIGWGGFVKKWK